MASSVEMNEVVYIELPAPTGWTKRHWNLLRKGFCGFVLIWCGCLEKKTAPEVIINDMRRDKTAKVMYSKRLCEQKKSSVFSAPVDLEPEVKSMTVPDPDFHNIDKDRMEISFDDNQVQAAYDDDDGMPLYYAMIHNVIS
ncbi:hypothetical protein RND71_009450 [Anisodus tanguticus]|uniref:DUF3444 domain-containing protein n=1 Tax=Anisodus tanguticus TaxID=243964 RepID=A0AAE1SH99_9SOLA|nr:hypothetical protein RND71_009450 [Anisodus tanguticus]